MEDYLNDMLKASRNQLSQIGREMLDMEYIYDVIYGRYDRIDQIRPILEREGIDFTPHVIMTVVFDDFWNYCINKNNRERQTIKRNMLLSCQDALAPDYRCVVATLTGTDKLAVVLDTGDRFGTDAEEYALGCAVRIRDHISEELGYSCSVGVSHYCASSHYLWHAYEESFKALQQGFFKGNSQVMLYSYPSRGKQKSLMISEFQAAKGELILALGNEDPKRCTRSVDLLMTALMNEGADMNDVKSTFIVTMSNMAEYALQLGMNANHLSERLIEVVGGITRSTTVFEVTKISTSFLLGIVGKRMEAKPSGIEGVINTAMAYTRQYLYLQLTLEDVAEVFGYNPSYFSRNFHKYCGMPFKEFLTQARIEKAKAYLESSDLTINEITAKVGFANRNYFSNVFRERTGTTPNSWRTEARKSLL